jgi:hypothetical protein
MEEHKICNVNTYTGEHCRNYQKQSCHEMSWLPRHKRGKCSVREIAETMKRVIFTRGSIRGKLQHFRKFLCAQTSNNRRVFRTSELRTSVLCILNPVTRIPHSRKADALKPALTHLLWVSTESVLRKS